MSASSVLSTVANCGCAECCGRPDRATTEERTRLSNERIDLYTSSEEDPKVAALRASQSEETNTTTQPGPSSPDSEY
ncbi:hypothetical protein QQS21_011531 [Conoideocrella luteorostrata]|uniref:Uncharacterized protein n=1 Tax=Conoideocrella luteorostrata TaxID=1105319 RepID=A0AAJ0CE03_9HYPO|nr:hypothetical protein QQS21_011531 [Conoideocrella luteorostrata]